MDPIKNRVNYSGGEVLLYLIIKNLVVDHEISAYRLRNSKPVLFKIFCKCMDPDLDELQKHIVVFQRSSNKLGFDLEENLDLLNSNDLIQIRLREVIYKFLLIFHRHRNRKPNFKNIKAEFLKPLLLDKEIH